MFGLSAETIELLCSGGPVAILAFIIFWMYRKDRKDTECRIHDIHQANFDRMENLLKKDQETREKQTTVLSELASAIKFMANCK